MKAKHDKPDGRPFNARPNLLGFCNRARLQPFTAFNLNSGQVDPDVGFFVPDVCSLREMDEEGLKEFIQDYEVSTWLGACPHGKSHYLYGMVHFDDEMSARLFASASEITDIYDNQKQEWI